VTQVNESILGGLQVMVGDKFLDLSVAARVADLNKSLESSA
jgi:F0F1-type ATP synthase delta subunit